MNRRRTVPALALGATAAALTAALPGTPANAAPPAATGWSADLSAVDGDDVNVRHDGRALRLASGRGPASLRGASAAGQLLLAPRELAEPVNRVAARVTGAGSVQVDVRALTAAGQWTEWTPAGTALAAGSRRIQARVVLTGAPGGTAPSVSAVRLTGDRVAARGPGAAAAALTYQVFATREGLVGGTTANGHVITARDHFVALPSRRGLSSNGGGEYSVTVCAASGSPCEYAPVWDVGPWNTHDDYWNPSATREMWQDLPQGRPESQAAYQDGYNGGKDEFARTVANPAGIDLADGTFWDGLGLTDNSWVNVTYAWTAAGAKGTVRTGGAPVTVRAAASAASASRGLAADRAGVAVQCQVRGQSVTGTYGTSAVWNRIGAGHYVPAAYIQPGPGAKAAPAC